MRKGSIRPSLKVTQLRRTSGRLKEIMKIKRMRKMGSKCQEA